MADPVYNSIHTGMNIDDGITAILQILALNGIIVSDGNGNFSAKSTTLTDAELNTIVQAVLDTGLVNVAINGY